MEKTGVELVVEGLSAFLSEMGKADKAVGNFGKSGSLLGTIFSKVGDVISGLIGGVFRILEYTLGNLLASAIQSVVGWLKDMAAGVLESADTFAKLEIRLRRMNFNAARDSGLEYNAAMEEAIKLTKEQLEWTIRLGAQTPFDAVDIAKVYTLARSYGFTAGESKSLTDAIIDFTSGMGLTNVEMERIVINFGQLRQQGKLNAQDLRDLARGAYVPINDVLAITAKKLGLTTEEFNKQRKAGTLGAEAVDVFRQSFEELVGVNFEGAAQDLGNVFKVAVENITHLIRDMLALYNVLPVLTLIGTYLQDVSDAISKNDERWNTVTASLKRISDTIFEIVSSLLGLAPSADEIADSIVKGLDSVATWLEEHQDDIVQWVQDALVELGKIKDWVFGTDEQQGALPWLFETGGKIKTWVQDEVLPELGKIKTWIDENVVPAFNTISDWVDENGLLIKEFFKTLGEIIAEVWRAITSQPGKPGDDGLAGTLQSIKDSMQWVIDNKEAIIKWIEVLWSVFIVWQVVSTIIVFAAKVILAAALAVKGFLFIWGLLSPSLIWIGGLLSFVVGVLWTIAAPILIAVAVIAGLLLHLALFRVGLLSIIGAVDIFKEYVIRKFTEWKENVTRVFNEVMDAIKNKDWWGVGKALVDGIWRGIKNNFWQIIDLAKSLGQNAIDAFNAVFDNNSPSGIMYGIGENITQGLANGITSRSDEVAKAASDAAYDAYLSAKGTLRVYSPSRLFMGIGENLMKGFALGISDTAHLAVKAMQNASAGVLMPAMTASNVVYNATKNSQNTVNNTPTLNIHTNAQTENIVSDFAMMQSLAGG